MNDADNKDLTRKELLWLRTILQFLAIDRTIATATQAEMASEAGLGKDTLIRFMNGEEAAKDGTTANHARKIKPVLQRVCRDDLAGEARLAPLEGVIFDLFGDLKEEVAARRAELGRQKARNAARGSNGGGIIKNQGVRDTLLPVELDLKHHARTLASLQGLWLLIRPATDGLGHSSESVHSPLYSISLLNILSEGLDRGSHYPLFKVRQGGDVARGRPPFVFEGVVVPHADRAWFVGALRTPSRLFAMTVSYQLDDDDRHLHQLHGVMLGITSQKASVASAHVCLFVPGTDRLGPQEFDERVEEYVTLIGSNRTENDLVATFKTVGIKVDQAAWAHISTTFNERRSFRDD